MNKKFIVGIALALMLFILPSQAFAYLDPGTGSYFFQIFIALIVSSLFLIKLWFRNIKNFILRIFSKKVKNDRD